MVLATSFALPKPFRQALSAARAILRPGERVSLQKPSCVSELLLARLFRSLALIVGSGVDRDLTSVGARHHAHEPLGYKPVGVDEPAAVPTGWFAADAAHVKRGATVAVVGDGAVGLLGVLSAKQMGAERIIAMSRHPARQTLAREFGATDIVTERGDEGIAHIKELTKGVGTDAVLECVGTQESMKQAVGSTRPGGGVGYVGVPHGVELNGEDLFYAHVRLHGGPAPVRRYLPELIELTLNGKIRPGKVFDLTLPLEKWRKAIVRWTSVARSKHFCVRKESKMRTRLTGAIAMTAVALTMIAAVNLAGREQRVGTPADRDRFIGGWRLVSLEEPRADGTVHKADATGLFVFTRDGHASVQVMYRNTATTATPSDYAQGGYEATYGRYDVDERSKTFTFHVEGALVRTLLGKDLPRLYEFSGNQLIVKPSSPNEHWRVTWERY